MNPDFLIIGAGMVGLALARELKARYPDQQVLMLEKEPQLGLHASGRNSGVLHSGIYYPAGSLKAKVCAQGAKELADYCLEHDLPFRRPGKLLVPTREQDAPQLDLLEQRARDQGIAVERVDEQLLRNLEPDIRSATGQALLVPVTAVVSPRTILQHLAAENKERGVMIRTGDRIQTVDVARKQITTTAGRIRYGHAINCAGAYADKVAQQFGAARDYSLLPFRGGYWKLDPDSGIRVHHLIYPVPDLRVPFLGVHTTTSVEGHVYLGPTATPAFGRESYQGLRALSVPEVSRIGARLTRQFLAGQDGFRRLALQETWRATKSGFHASARALLPKLRKHHLLPAPDKTGIRPQLLDLRNGRLVMDFLVEQSPGATHVLNAISPAFTSSFALARHLIDTHIAQGHV